MLTPSAWRPAPRFLLPIGGIEHGDLKTGHLLFFHHAYGTLGLEKLQDFRFLRRFQPLALPVNLHQLFNSAFGDFFRKRGKLQHRQRHFPEVLKDSGKLWKISVRPADDRVAYCCMFYHELLPPRAPYA